MTYILVLALLAGSVPYVRFSVSPGTEEVCPPVVLEPGDAPSTDGK